MRAALTVCVVALPLALAAGLRAEETRAARAARAGDAALRAVQFVEKDVGWAVGDDGVILATIDGGKTWEPKPSGVRGSLRSVHFLDPYRGWVAGREELPDGRSVGVLLYTRDGGETWRRMLNGALPGLNRVRFVAGKTGYLLGDGCEQFPSGVFRTDDNGKSWEPVPGPRATTWLGADFADAQTALLAGAWSRLATLKGKQFRAAADLDRLAGRHIHALTILKQRALAVAEGGVILTSQSGGAGWGFLDVKLPADLRACLDLRTMHAVGSKVWCAGRPGSVVLHSPDAGASWQVQKTGQPLPLHGVFFFDEQRGWAVGAAGTVLATNDGGATWKSQRRGGTRAAALVVTARGRDLPVDTFAVLGGAEGYLTQALAVVAPDPVSAAPAEAAAALRLDGAVRRAGGLGGETLWNFALPQYLEAASKQSILDHWNRVHAGSAERELMRQLVLTLRVWRPGAVLADLPGAKEPLRALVAEAVQEAVRQAADPRAFPEQIEALGLAAWKVSRVYGMGERAGASIVQENHTPYPALRATPQEYAAPAARILQGALARLPAHRFYRTVPGDAGTGAGPKHWLVGVACPLGECRRTLPQEEKDLDVVALRRAIRRRDGLVTLAENMADPATTLGQLAPLLGREGDDGAETAYAVAATYARRGQWQLAQQAYLLLIDRQPAHPLAAEAYRWLIQHNSSGEARRRHALKQFVMTTSVKYEQKASGSEPGAVRPAGGTGPINEGMLSFLGDGALSRHWYRSSLEVGKRLSGFGPAYSADPAVQFCLQSARRHVGEAGAARTWFEKFHTYVPTGPWHDAAAAELWQSGGGDGVTRPRRVGRCQLTESRPYLDGKLDDACWQRQAPMRLEDAAGKTVSQYSTQVMFAYDQEFLYVAMRCKHPRGQGQPPIKGRRRDAELGAYDRVSLLLDVDRDYATAYHLQVDQRGAVREECWGDPGWNPRWFVAVRGEEDAWQLEAAIPLAELTTDRLELGHAWAFNVVRVLPGRGVQGWSRPADVLPRPEGMSLLRFERDPARDPVRPMPKAR